METSITLEKKLKGSINLSNACTYDEMSDVLIVLILDFCFSPYSLSPMYSLIVYPDVPPSYNSATQPSFITSQSLLMRLFLTVAPRLWWEESKLIELRARKLRTKWNIERMRENWYGKLIKWTKWKTRQNQVTITAGRLGKRRWVTVNEKRRRREESLGKDAGECVWEINMQKRN